MGTTIVTSSQTFIDIGGVYFEVTWERVAIALGLLAAAIVLLVWLFRPRHRDE